MKKILLPTDFSEQSDKAVSYALEVFGRSVYPETVEFVLLTIHDALARPTQTVPPYVYSFPVLPEEVMSNVEDELKERAAAFRKSYPGLRIRERAIMGKPVFAIQEAALDESANLIVMGTKGLSGLERMILGSVASEVARKAPCPILAVPGTAVVRPPKSVVLATDFRNLRDLNILRPLRDVVKALSPQFLLLHIFSEKDSAPRDRDVMNRILRNYFNTEHYSYYFMEYANPIEGMEEFLSGYSEGLLALVGQERGFLERVFHRSVTQKMLAFSDVPIMVLNPLKTVREKERPQPEAEKTAA